MKSADDNHELFGDGVDASVADVVANLGEAEIKDKWPKMLVDYIDVVAAKFVRDGMAKDDALHLATGAVTAICEAFGGQTHYLPRGDSVKRAIRDKRVWEDFNGRNVHELVRKYRLSEMKIYTILKEQKHLHAKQLHSDLFDN